MPAKLTIEETSKGVWRFAYDAPEHTAEELTNLAKRTELGLVGRAEALEAAGRLIEREPDWPEARVLRAELLTADDRNDEAERDYEAAYEAGLALAPKAKRARIPWMAPGNRAFLRAARGLADVMTADHDYAGAETVLRRLLAWAPDDERETLCVLGPVLLRQRLYHEAKRVLRKAADNGAVAEGPMLFELALAHIECEEWYEAGAALRRAWIANPYIPELLACGDGNPPKGYAADWPSNGAAGALEYVDRWGRRWEEHEEALEFLWWLYNTTDVLLERAEGLKRNERLLWEMRADARAKLAGSTRRTWKIPKAKFEAMIAERPTMRDGTGRPWRTLQKRRWREDSAEQR